MKKQIAHWNFCNVTKEEFLASDISIFDMLIWNANDKNHKGNYITIEEFKVHNPPAWSIIDWNKKIYNSPFTLEEFLYTNPTGEDIYYWNYNNFKDPIIDPEVLLKAKEYHDNIIRLIKMHD